MGCLTSRNQGVEKLEEDKLENFTQVNAVKKRNMSNAKHKRRREDGNNSNRPTKSSRTENEKAIAEYKGELQSAEKDNTKLQEKLADQSENRKGVADYKAKLQSAIKENTTLQEKLTEANENLTRKDNRIHTLENKVETLTTEKDSLLTRLSTIAGANLTNNNPNIADLSDSNRPTKLAERYTELYDNEWTDTLTAIENTGIQEREGLDILRDILMDIYKLCETSAESHLKSLSKAIEQLTKVDKILPVEVIKELKETRKKNYKSFLPELSKEMDLRLKNRGADEETRLYKSQCLELCWLMCIQDPPVHMDCDDAVHGKPFRREVYKTYTQSGKMVDYIVWPALFIHKGGPVLCKGTAQGMSPRLLPTPTSGARAGTSKTRISVKL